MPFRDAHHVTGQIVRLAEQKKLDLAGLSLADMQAIEPRITAELFNVLTVEASVASRISYGGTAPGNVAKRGAEMAGEAGMKTCFIVLAAVPRAGRLRPARRAHRRPARRRTSPTRTSIRRN